MKEGLRISMAKLIQILDTKMTEPGLFGWFHILWLVITVAAAVFLSRYCKAGTPERTRRVVLITAITVIVLEIYKQFNFTYTVDGGKIIADYAWYAFPFQFCSTPMYVGLLAGLTRKGKVHESLCAYLATYAVFAGTAVMIYPGDVYVETIGINIQTMICHGSMIVVGACLFASGYVKTNWKTVLKAMPVFAVTVGMAAVMNEIAALSGLLKTDNFNMFFISRHTESTLPIYGLVHEAVPFPVNLVIYIVGFTAAASVMLLIAMGIKKLGKKSTEKETVSI